MARPPILQPEPPPRKSGRAARLWLVGAVALVVAIVSDKIRIPLRSVGIPTGIFSFLSFCSILLFVAISLYGLALITRLLLRHLFWRVGRRLFLSYVMIGLLPFFLFGFLLLAIAYCIGGLMSQAALRGRRQAHPRQLEATTPQDPITGDKHPRTLPTVESYHATQPAQTP